MLISLAGYESVERVVVVEPGRNIDLGKISLAASLRPRVLNLEPVTLKIGEAFRRTLEIENGPSRLAIADLPDGLTFNSNTRTITGTISKAGAFLAKVSARGPGNFEVNDTLEFHVKETIPLEKSPRVKDGQAKIYKGQAFHYKIDADGSPTEYGASGLPEGLKIDEKTGRLSGRTEEVGEFTVTLYANNAAGRGSGELQLEVAERVTDLEKVPAPAAPVYAYTFLINGAVLHATADGRILDANGTVVGQLGPGVMQNSVGQLNFGVNGYLHAYPDGSLVAVFPNGAWVIRGTWRVGG